MNVNSKNILKRSTDTKSLLRNMLIINLESAKLLRRTLPYLNDDMNGSKRILKKRIMFAPFALGDLPKLKRVREELTGFVRRSFTVSP